MQSTCNLRKLPSMASMMFLRSMRSGPLRIHGVNVLGPATRLVIAI